MSAAYKGQPYLATVPQLKLSVGAIVEAIHSMARHGRSALEEILERIRGPPVVHAAETGWREDGVNGFVWTFSTPTERYLLRRGRGKGVVDEVLGESIGGVLVSDSYAAYNHHLGLKRRCWVQLLRDIHDLEAAFPADQSLKRWAGEVRRLYDRARECVGDEGVVSGPQLDLEKRLLALCRPFSNDRRCRPSSAGALNGSSRSRSSSSRTRRCRPTQRIRPLTMRPSGV